MHIECIRFLCSALGGTMSKGGMFCNHAISMGVGMAMSVGPPQYLNNYYIKNFFIYIHGPQRVKPADVGDRLTFELL